MTPSRILLNHEPKLYFSERISLRDFMARFEDAIAGKDKCAADDLKYNWRIQDDGAYRVGYLMVFQHSGDGSKKTEAR